MNAPPKVAAVQAVMEVDVEVNGETVTLQIELTVGAKGSSYQARTKTADGWSEWKAADVAVGAGPVPTDQPSPTA
jgi:hypothetical protein